LLKTIYLKILQVYNGWKAVFLLFLICIPAILTAQKEIINPQTQQLLSNSNKSQFFIENKGQWPKQVKFLARLGGMNAWITDSGVVYDYYRIDRNYSPDSLMRIPLHEKNEFERTHTSCKGQVVRMDYNGINLNAEKQGIDKREAYYNYFIGNDSTKWASFVGLYGEVLVKDAYSGIDIRYYFDSGQIRYDYLVKPGADISQINFRLTGADALAVNENGELYIKTSLGEVKHGKLYAYQQIGNEKSEVSCRFERNEDGNFGVKASNYEKGLALVIDPLVWSTFLGGSKNDYAGLIFIDINKNVYISGSTHSSDFPTTTGSYNLTMNGSEDIFISLLNSSASSLIYSTYIGGSHWQSPCNLKIDAIGNIYTAGYTDSYNFPTTNGAFDQTFNDSGTYYINDLFVVKLNSTGSKLIYSTYIGGKGDDNAYDMVIDDLGNAYLTGLTSSSGFPTTKGAYNQIINGSFDCFISKLNPIGTALVYSTFIGGTDDDFCYTAEIDKNYNIYISGETRSADYPTTTGVYDRIINGYFDAFITKINSTGSALVFSTYIGGKSFETVYALTLDKLQNIYIAGRTGSSDFPTTIGAFDHSIDSFSDVFVSKLNSSATKLLSSTFIGGNYGERPCSIGLDGNDNVYLAGFTESTNFPVTPDAFNKSYGGGTQDAFLAKFITDLSVLMYSTYIGGIKQEEIGDISVDTNGEIYLTGSTFSPNFPTTPGVFDQNIAGNDAFITKLFIISQAYNVYFKDIICSQMSIFWKKGEGKKRLVFMKEGSSGYPMPINNTPYIADTVFGSGSQIGSSGWYCVYNDIGASVNVSGLKLNTLYRIMVLEVWDSNGIDIYLTDSAYNNPVNLLSGSFPVAAFAVNSKQQYLTGNNFAFSSASTTPKTKMNFYWYFGDGDSSTSANPIHSYKNIGSFKVMMIAYSFTGCADTMYDSVRVLQNLPLTVSFVVKNACVGEEVLFLNTSIVIPPDSFLNFLWDFGDASTIVKKNPKHIYTSSGKYIISLVALTAFGSKDTLTDTIEIFADPVVNIAASPDTIVIPGSPVILTASGLFDQLLWFDNSNGGSVNVTTEGTYWVIASYTNGCKSTDSIILTKADLKVAEPVNAITPNGDGINDFLVIKNIDQIKPCKLAIYNRWGDELLTTSDYQNNWDGTYKGKKLPEGTYYYVLETRDGKVYKGAVNILK
jgi:gliding motility-associated-like protein